MPVHLDTHTPEADLTPGTTKSDIVAFLYDNLEYGYKPIEIRNHLDIPHGTATTTLKRLHEEGYIGKTDDSYYHALDNREDLRRYVASLDQLQRMFNRPTDETDMGDAPAEDIDIAAVEDELDALENEIQDE
ncbi:MarR family transcriptional regulator [Halocatena pleomorpha]|uniref:MarR family transcriptional regulator n=1 Tax=Halocatena pleomorpha TaxID=1785090 RepID=A0A3P3R5D2_9EURY|nr:MarR family transcriptional regulator [Halocatena pleomorpha]RRJ28099.1 MarR family transcriptional regulator [Halocatena pleomorpha]